MTTFRRPFEPGGYPGVVRLADGSFSADISLGANEPPGFNAYSETAKAGGFPRSAGNYERVLAHLRRGDDVVFGPVRLREPFPGAYVARAPWALVGVGIREQAEWPKATAFISGLEMLLPSPMRSVSWPQDFDGTQEQELSATFVAEPIPPTMSEGVELQAQFNVRFSLTDRFAHEIHTQATIALKASDALDVSTWRHDWLQPLASLVSIATGRQESLRLVTLEAGEEEREAAGLRAVLFAADVGQDPVDAAMQVDGAGQEIIPLFTLADAPPLAALVPTWKTLSSAWPAMPLLLMSQADDIDPQVRYFLLAQSAESLHRSDREEREMADWAAAKEQMKVVIQAVRNAGLASEARFLKDQTVVKSPETLAGRLRELFRLPALVAHVPTWERHASALFEFLHGLDKQPSDLADCLAIARNVIAHGGASIPAHVLRPAANALDLVVRVAVLSRLGFSEAAIGANVHRIVTEKQV